LVSACKIKTVDHNFSHPVALQMPMLWCLEHQVSQLHKAACS
jgi:hypothetical protein